MDENATIPFALILDWVEGRLPGDEATQMSRAVQAAGGSTQITVAWLEAFQAMSEEVQVEALPLALHRELSELFQREGQAPQAQPTLP